MPVKYGGTRLVTVYYVGDYKVMVDPEEGSTSCECAEHTQWVLDPLNQPRCAHSAAVWRLMHAGGLLG